MKIVMAAAENDALAGGKIGGIGDVVRDMPPALADLGHTVDVLTPGYGHLSQHPGAEPAGEVRVGFRGGVETVAWLRVPGRQPQPGVSHWVCEHAGFSPAGPGRIYCDDGADRPFATDANKFALFSAAVAQALLDGLFGKVDVLHLHDWHAALVALLRAHHHHYEGLRQIHTVYTIHNLALQGIRPREGDHSSLAAWFPGFWFDDEGVWDPRAHECLNPTRAAINLCDRVHAVSPTYAREILRPSDPEHGFFGGEGLEADLSRADDQGRLVGILNGCVYPEPAPPAPVREDVLALADTELLAMIGRSPVVDSAHLIALRRLAERRQTADASSAQPEGQAPLLMTSVGRLTQQKVLILRQRLADGRSALEHVLDRLGDEDLFALLGSGDPALEQFITEVASRDPRLLFIKGYSDAMSAALYAVGELFLMPSSFEPCGISQMLAMRAGQPCLVHAVGGLADTVIDGDNGFSFLGDTPVAQAEAMLARLDQALCLRRDDDARWRALRQSAANSRFSWAEAAGRCLAELYT